ncbi:MAG: hypothetical protein ABF301_07885 [Sulfurovum sp.]
MPKITIDVDNKDKETVLTILKNLKQGLIKGINIDNKSLNTNSSLNKQTKRQKLLEDEFLPKPISGNNRYLSKEQFKAKLTKSKD